MKHEVGFYLTTHYVVEKWSEKRGTKETYEFDNIVLNVGYDNLIKSYPNPRVPLWLYLGTGTTEPERSQTGLQSISPTLPARRSTGQTSRYHWWSVDNSQQPWESIHNAFFTFNYGEGEAAGTWTELGQAFGSTYTEPYNRSLFRDVNGNPVAITVLADEYLRIFSSCNLHLNAAWRKGSFLFNGVPIGYTVKVPGDSGGSSVSPIGNIWTNGFPVSGSLKNGFASAAAGGFVYSNTVTGMLVSGSFSAPVGVAGTFDRVRFGCWANNITSWETPISVEFDTPITKLDSENCDGSWVISMNRSRPYDVKSTVTAGGNNTLTDSTQSWTVNQWAGYEVIIVRETGVVGELSQQSRTILSNTADTITVDVNWEENPDATTKYGIREYVT